jgi:6-pyruvoyltetrahydropterin/6-carboxytetrahydropterin synthase
MYKVTKRIHFCYGHRLLHHPGKCARIHGHNAIAEILCGAQELDKGGMVIDFEKISRSLEGWINDTLDHRMIVNKGDELVTFLTSKKEPFLSLGEDPTAEVIAKLIFDQAKNSGLPVKKVILWETPDSSASYEGHGA